MEEPTARHRVHEDAAEIDFALSCEADMTATPR